MFSYSHCPSPFPNFFNSCTTHDCLVFMSLLQYTTQFCFLQTLLPVFTPQIVFQEFLVHLIYFRGTRSRSWLRHYATNRILLFTPSPLLGLNIFFGILFSNMLSAVSVMVCAAGKKWQQQTDKDCSTFQTEHSLGKNLEWRISRVVLSKWKLNGWLMSLTDHGENRCRLRFTGSHVIKLFQPTLINSDSPACLSIWVILPV